MTRLGSVAAGAALAFLMAGCGGAEDASPLAAHGREVANSAGCSACHGTDGRSGGVGPGWVGLAGATIDLDDGSQIVADSAYLRRAITDPLAEVRAGYTVQMPAVDLSDADVDSLVAYIEELE